MSASRSDSDGHTSPKPRPRPAAGALAGYAIYALGILAGAFLAMTYDTPRVTPHTILLVIWIVAGLTHANIREFKRACNTAAVISTVVYAMMVLLFFKVNEMFGAGIIIVGVLAYIMSYVMGLPVLLYRQRREARAASGPAGGESGPSTPAA